MIRILLLGYFVIWTIYKVTSISIQRFISRPLEDQFVV